ncbi:MAG: hypothetical protein ABS81_17175 [Pseudonocardia sp. SCN 72-86]|nr:MAG: hypothetical protein ABS81_17175 [Pseudonocardia sp. SCN 72-86]
MTATFPSLRAASPVDAVLLAVVGAAGDTGTGSVALDGDTRVRVHVERGTITFAEAPDVPFLGDRLVNSRLVAADDWDAVLLPDGDTGVANRVAAHGLVPPTVFAAVVASATLDALDLLTGPGDLRAQALDDDADWLRSPLRLEPAVVARELAARRRRREQAERRLGVALGPGTVVESHRDADRARPGSATVLDLARTSGRSLHEVCEEVAGLVEAGECVVSPPVPRPAQRRRHVSRTAPSEVRSAGPAPAVRGGPLPRRTPGAEVPAPGEPGDDILGRPFTEPDSDTLHRVLRGLGGV